MTYQPAQPAQPAPYENVGRGTVVALFVIPVGVIVWVIIWSIGFIASIVSFGVALLAMFLYRLGSGGQMGRAGAVRVTIITIVTVGLAIFAGLVSDVAIGIGLVAHVSPIEALGNSAFWNVFSTYLAEAEGLTFNLLLAAGFGVLGCFSILRAAFKAPAANAVAGQQAWPQNPTNPQQQAWPQNPQPGTQPFPPAEPPR